MSTDLPRSRRPPSVTGLAGSESRLQARILLVEDNVEILDLMAMHLRDTYVVFTAEDGQEGLEMAQRERPDLIVTDFMMPKMDGLSMLKALRAEPQAGRRPGHHFDLAQSAARIGCRAEKLARTSI